MDYELVVGMDPYRDVPVVQVKLVDPVSKAQVGYVEMDENEAEAAATLFRTGQGILRFTTGPAAAIGAEVNPDVERWLRSAAAHLRAHKAGEVDLRKAGFGKTPDA